MREYQDKCLWWDLLAVPAVYDGERRWDLDTISQFAASGKTDLSDLFCLVPAVYDGPSLVPFSVDDAYEVEQWSRVLRRLHVGPGGEVELLHLSTARLTHGLRGIKTTAKETLSLQKGEKSLT